MTTSGPYTLTVARPGNGARRVAAAPPVGSLEGRLWRVPRLVAAFLFSQVVQELRAGTTPLTKGRFPCPRARDVEELALGLIYIVGSTSSATALDPRGKRTLRAAWRLDSFIRGTALSRATGSSAARRGAISPLAIHSGRARSTPWPDKRHPGERGPVPVT